MVHALDIVYICMSVFIVMALQMRQRRVARIPTLKLQKLSAGGAQNEAFPRPGQAIDRTCGVVDIRAVAQRGTENGNPQNAGERDHPYEQDNTENCHETRE